MESRLRLGRIESETRGQLCLKDTESEELRERKNGQAMSEVS